MRRNSGLIPPERTLVKSGKTVSAVFTMKWSIPRKSSSVSGPRMMSLQPAMRISGRWNRIRVG